MLSTNSSLQYNAKAIIIKDNAMKNLITYITPSMLQYGKM